MNNPFAKTLYVDVTGFREENLEWALYDIVSEAIKSTNPNYLGLCETPNHTRALMFSGHAGKGAILTTVARRWYWSASAPQLTVIPWNGRPANPQSQEYWAFRHFLGLDHTKARTWVTKPPKKLKEKYASAIESLYELSPVAVPLYVIREPEVLDYKLWDSSEVLFGRRDFGEPISLDIETTSLSASEGDLLGFSLSGSAKSGTWVPSVDANCGIHFALPNEFITHNGGFDISFLRAKGFPARWPKHDTKILAYLLGHTNTNLKSLGEKVLGRSVITYQDVTGDEDTLVGVPEEDLVAYGCQDADLTYSLWEKFMAELPPSMDYLYQEIEMPLIPILRQMTEHGALIDRRVVEELGRETEEKVKSLEEVLEVLVGEKFDVASNEEVARILFDKLGLPVLKIGKMGRKVDTWTFEELDHPVVDIIDSLREHNKLLSTYVRPLLANDQPRVHGRFHQTVTQTGRLSSSGPNLQNQDPRIRKAYIAPPGGVLIVADYSQQELRILAEYSQDPEWLRWFRDGVDAHTETAKLLGIERKKAKIVNFGIPYGAGKGAVARQARIPMAEAATIMNSHRAMYRGVWDWIEGARELARARGYAESLWGRRRWLPGFQSEYPEDVASAERMAANMPIQGSAADITKLAMVRVNEICDDKCRMILQVHDELVFECRDYEYAEKILPKIKEIMENVGKGKMEVPLVVEPKIARNWAEGK